MSKRNISVIKSFFSISGCILGSRITGFIRESLIARTLGVSWITDVFLLSLKLPALFRRIFADGALNNSLVPIINDIQGDNRRKIFISEMMAFSSLVILSIVILIEIYMRNFLSIIFSVQNEEKFDFLILLSRISMPFLAIMFWTSIYGAMLNVRNKFVPFAIAPMVANIFILLGIGIVIFYEIDQNIKYTAIIFVCLYIYTGFVQLLNVVYFFYREYDYIIFPRFIFRNISQELKMFFKKFIPVMFSSSISQISVFVTMAMGSCLPSKGVSYLSLSDTLNQFPISIIGISMNTVLVSVLSCSLQEKNFESVRIIQKNFFELASVLSITCAFFMGMFSHSIIDIVYGWGRVTNIDVLEISRTLASYAFGLPGSILIKMMSMFFFARLQTKVILRLSIIVMVLDILFAYIGMYFFEHRGIALGVSLANILSMIGMYFFTRKSINFKLCSRFCVKFVCILLINMCVVYMLKYLIKYDIVCMILSFVIYVFCIYVFRLLNVEVLKHLYRG